MIGMTCSRQQHPSTPPSAKRCPPLTGILSQNLARRLLGKKKNLVPAKRKRSKLSYLNGRRVGLDDSGRICPSSELLIRSRRLARTGIHQLRASPQGLLNQGRPIPRLAPVIKIVLYSMFIWFSFYGCPFCLLLRIARRGRVHPARKIL